MTSLNLDENNAIYQIRAFKPGTIQINETTFNKSLIVSSHQLITDWPPQSASELTSQSFASIIPLKPDVLLIGTGAQLIFLPESLYGELINLGIGVEVMNTGAACRTFNALTAEDRNVIAALLLN